MRIVVCDEPFTLKKLSLLMHSVIILKCEVIITQLTQKPTFMRISPVSLTFSKSWSRLITRITSSSMITFDGSPIQVLQMRYPWGGLMGLKEKDCITNLPFVSQSFLNYSFYQLSLMYCKLYFCGSEDIDKDFLVQKSNGDVVFLLITLKYFLTNSFQCQPHS